MQRKITIEVCCGSVSDAVEAQRGGADRVELNSGIMFGGLTPSAGAIIEAKRRLNIPVMVMIRPREGGFCYSEEELSVMEEDIKMALSCGADGIVFGALKEDGQVDEEKCMRLIELCKNKEVVFHRAIDVVPDVFKALDKLISLGIKRVLTKGQENSLEEGWKLIREMVNYCGNRLEILPGGVKLHNVDEYLPKLGCNQIHIASFIPQIDSSVSKRSHVYFGSASKNIEDRYNLIDESFVKSIRNIADNIKKDIV